MTRVIIKEKLVMSRGKSIVINKPDTDINVGERVLGDDGKTYKILSVEMPSRPGKLDTL